MEILGINIAIDIYRGKQLDISTLGIYEYLCKVQQF